MIKNVENSENSFREVLKERSIPEHADFQSKARNPERMEENLLRLCLRAQMGTVDFLKLFLISCR